MSGIIKCKFCKPGTENFSILGSCLPNDSEYMVCSLSAERDNFKARLRTCGKNAHSARKWLEDFQMQSKCTMRVDRTYPHSGTKNMYKVDLRCQHNTRPRNEKVREKESKNTDCPAKMGITIKRVMTERKSRSKDPHMPDYPTIIQMDFCHNHAILTPEILKHRSVLPDVKEKILDLFNLGHTPSTALDMHKYDLLLEYGENFDKVCHDRALLPDSQYCYRLYYRILRKDGYSANCENTESDVTPPSPHKKAISPLSNCENSVFPPQEDAFETDTFHVDSNEKKKKRHRKLENCVVAENEMSSQLTSQLCKFCENGGYAGMQIIENDTIMALCTPLMHRVHTLIRHSGELIFVDSYGDLDEPGSCKVFMLVTYSSVGAVPVGCIVTTSTTATCIKSAVDLWKQILPPGCFYGKNEGPDIFFTNDNETEKQSLSLSFPNSQLLVCISHILQASWVFLLDRKNAVKKEHRSHFISKIKMLLLSQNVEELELNYTYTLRDNLVKSNAIFVNYFKDIYNHRHDWSLLYRRHLLPRGNDLAMFWESVMILQKDPILSRTQTYNPLQVIDFLSRLDTYYERKLIDLANNRFDSVRLSRFLFIELPREAYVITQNSEIEYEVHNDTKDLLFQVDISLGVCECREGRTGAPCKHQLLVVRNFPIPVYDCVPPSTPAERTLLLRLATGLDELASDNVAKPSNGTSPLGETCSSGISIQDLDPCNEGDFFLDETLNQNPVMNNETVLTHGIMNPSQQVTVLNLPPNALIPTGHILEEHPEINASDTILPQHTLIPQLVPNSTQTLPLAPHLNPSLEHVNVDLVSVPQSTTPCPTAQESENNSVCNIIDKICSELKERSLKSPSSFKPALGAFLKNLDHLSSDSSLEYALYTFGKFSKLGVPLFKRKIIDNKLVGLQSTGKLKKRRQDLTFVKSDKRKL